MEAPHHNHDYCQHPLIDKTMTQLPTTFLLRLQVSIAPSDVLFQVLQ